MSRIIDSPVSVRVAQDGSPFSEPVPTLFRHRRQEYPCRVMETWRDTGEWWNGEAEKVFYRVAVTGRPGDAGAAGERLFELYQDTGNRKWYLYKAYD